MAERQREGHMMPIPNWQDPDETFIRPRKPPPRPTWDPDGDRDALIICAVVFGLAIFACAWAVLFR